MIYQAFYGAFYAIHLSWFRAIQYAIWSHLLKHPKVRQDAQFSLDIYCSHLINFFMLPSHLLKFSLFFSFCFFGSIPFILYKMFLFWIVLTVFCFSIFFRFWMVIDTLLPWKGYGKMRGNIFHCHDHNFAGHYHGFVWSTLKGMWCGYLSLHSPL